MAAWRDVVADVPEFAATVEGIFDTHPHKTIATVRKGGAPRISGIEASFADGELWFGMMTGSRKARDLQRDGRFALHSASADPGDAERAALGDAKLSGLAVEVTDGSPEGGEGHLFRVEVREVVRTRVGDNRDRIIVELWREGEGLRVFERA
jgi:hypothetical protein